MKNTILILLWISIPFFNINANVNSSDSLELVNIFNNMGGSNWDNVWTLTDPISTWYGVTLSADGCCIEQLDLLSNDLSGTLFDFNLPNLTYLDMGVSDIEGTIPDFQNMPLLVSLFLDANDLVGSVPDFSNFPNIEWLQLNNNELTGALPPLESCPNLTTLYLSSNNLSGCYPSSYCNLTQSLFNSNIGLPNGGVSGTFFNICMGITQTGLTCDDGNVSTVGDVILEDCTCGVAVETCTQSISLNPGWNLISLDLVPNDNSVAAVFSSLQSGNLAFVTGFNNGTLVFDPNVPAFLNTLSTVNKGFGYWVRVNNADVLTINGDCIEDTYRKEMDAGWNLVAFPPDLPASPADYFSDLISSNNLTFVTGFNNGLLIFEPNIPTFLNTLIQLENGSGYWIRVNNAVPAED